MTEINGPSAAVSHGLTLALCPAVWLFMALLPLAVYRLARRNLTQWAALLALNAGLWTFWITQYHLLAFNPAWATSGTRTALLLIESAGSAVILFAMMFRERARVRSRNLARLEWDG